MSSNRIDKVNSLLEREIGKIILREISFPDRVLVTLTRVEATPNLIEAKVFISTYPEAGADLAFKILNQEVYNIQKKIDKKLKMRPVPKIVFLKDQISGKASRIEELLSQLKKEEK